jgi:hypothetical protein
VKSLGLKVRNPSEKNNTTTFPPALHQAFHICAIQEYWPVSFDKPAGTQQERLNGSLIALSYSLQAIATAPMRGVEFPTPSEVLAWDRWRRRDGLG